jgi:hypothetical protein
MARFAVVQNGTDVARSSWADTAECYRACARLASDDITVLTPEFYADDAAESLLATLDPDELACLVLTSNALTSGQVMRGVTRHLDRLHEYIDNGGGLLVLHQWLDSLAPVVPAHLCPPMFTRRSQAPDPAGVHTHRRDDLLLHFPEPVDIDGLRDGGHENGPDWFYFKAFDVATLPSELKAVLVGGDGEAVLVRTDDHRHERVVLCTPLLDWQGRTALLANAIRWAAFGTPHRLLRRSPEAAAMTLLDRWLCTDGRCTVSVGTGAVSDSERWLLTDPESLVDMFVVPQVDVAELQTEDSVQRFLRRGGTMLTADAAGAPIGQVTAYVGDYVQRDLAASLYAEMRAVDGWLSVESAFDIRNIAGAVVLLWADPPNRTPRAVSPDELARLREEISARLMEPRHREDVASSIALAQTYALLRGEANPDLALVDWMADRPLARSFEVRLQLDAVTAGWCGKQAGGFLRDAAAALAAQPALASVSPVVRLLDSVALLDQLGLLPEDADGAAALAAAVVDRLDAFALVPETGWSSLEATADVVRGLVALLERLDPDQDDLERRLSAFTVAGADVLRRALRRYERNVRGVAWRARLTHALVIADRASPVALQRLATLEWPSDGARTGSPTAAERSLVEHLAGENKRLAEAGAALRRTLADQQEKLNEQRRSIVVGQATATWVPTLVLGAVGITAAVLVGSSSVWELLANVGVLLTALVTVLTLLYTWLARSGLLSPRATAIQKALEASAVPLITTLGRVKGRGKEK